LRQFFADTDAGVANLADDAGVVADELDALLLAKTHFAKPRLNFRRGGQFLDANNLTGLDATKRTNVRSGALAIQNFERLLPLAHGVTSVGRLKAGFKKRFKLPSSGGEQNFPNFMAGF
jgi:hypothetical protein